MRPNGAVRKDVPGLLLGGPIELFWPEVGYPTIETEGTVEEAVLNPAGPCDFMVPFGPGMAPPAVIPGDPCRMVNAKSWPDWPEDIFVWLEWTHAQLPEVPDAITPPDKVTSGGDLPPPPKPRKSKTPR
jgi:hypothetical protein